MSWRNGGTCKIARVPNGIVQMEVRNVADEVQRIHKSTVLGVAFQALEMKPCVDVDLKGSSIPPNDGTTDPTGVSVEPTGLPAVSTG